MNIRQLQVFQAVCNEGSVTKAASKLYMTQPAVTHVISRLEEETNCALFDRISRKLYINQAGKRFLEKSEQILELFDGISNHFYESEEQSPILLGSSITIANLWLPQMIKEFKRIWENTPVKIQIDRAGQIEEKLLNREIDLALLEGVVHSSHIVSLSFASYHISAFASPLHYLAGKKAVSLKELLAEDLYLREKGSAIRDAFDSAMVLNQLTADPVCSSVNSQALIQAAKQNLGITVLPDIILTQEQERSELVKLNVEGLELVNETSIAWNRDKIMSMQMKSFIEVVQRIL